MGGSLPCLPDGDLCGFSLDFPFCSSDLRFGWTVLTALNLLASASFCLSVAMLHVGSDTVSVTDAC